MGMKVKIFEEVVQPGSRTTLSDIERNINNWLEDNPECDIIDIFPSTGAAQASQGGNKLFCSIPYTF